MLWEFVNFYLIPGLVLGCIYGLGAIGVTLLFGILRFAHFAHGDMMTLGAYLALPLVLVLGLPVLVAMPVAAMGTIAIAITIDRWCYRPFRKSATIITVIASFGVALMARSLIQLFWGPENQNYVSGISRPMVLFDWLRIQPRHVLIILATVALVVALQVFLTRTRAGKAMRAMSDDPDLARLSGISTERTIAWTWVLGAGLAAVGGVFLAMDTQLSSMLGWNMILPMFAAALLGGVGKPLGAMAGGLIIGMGEELITYPWFGGVPLLPPSYKAAVAFAILIALLMFRPQGLFKGKLL